MTRHGVERFPSLVDAAREQREMSWRLADEYRESHEGRPSKATRRRKAMRDERILSLSAQGLSTKEIALAVGVSTEVVRLRVVRARAEAARQANADNKAVREALRAREGKV